MEILQICPGAYQSGRGGISEHIKNISERLAKRHDVTVYATNPGNSLPWYEYADGVRVRRFKRFSPSGSYFFSGHMTVKLCRAKFDVVHGHGYNAFPVHSAPLAASGKLIVSPHFHGVGHSVFRNCLFQLFKPIGKNVLTRADRIVAVSEFEKSLLCKYFNLASDHVVLIPNGLDLTEFVGLHRHRRSFRSILYVGRLETYKGIQYLVEALRRLEDDIVLEIVGTGSLKGTLEDRARQLKVDRRVLFHQGLSRRELLQKYLDADLFVLLSEYEAYSLAVAEALATGTPCIVANTSALTEWVDNVTCFGIEMPIRLSELLRLIRCVLDSSSDRKPLTASARPSASSKKILSWDEVVKRLECLYS